MLKPALSDSVSVCHFKITFLSDGLACKEDNEMAVCGQQAASFDLQASKAAIK